MRRNILIGTLVLIAAVIVAAVLIAWGGDTAVTAARFSAIRSDPTALRAFVRAMPKGGDLHVHLSGAVYAEDLIAWAKEKNLCAAQATKIVDCKEAGSVPMADVVAKQSLYDDLVNALSMRAFLRNTENPTGHDQFFATFGRFGGVT